MKLKAFFFEILPITTFFIIAQYQSIIIAALISSLFSLIVLITFYFVEKRIAKFQIFSITLKIPLALNRDGCLYMDVFILAIAVFLLFEGTTYSLFPEQTKKMLSTIMSMDTNKLRIFGLIMVVLGAIIVLLV